MTDDLDFIAVHLAARAPGAQNLDDLYHSTFCAGVFPYEEWTHFGSWAAAEHRARDIRQSYGLSENTPVTVHKAWLRGRVYPHVLTDEVANDIWGTGYVREIDEGLPSGQGYHIFPYRNDSEDPGSISYLAQRAAIHVVGTESIPRPGGPCETALPIREPLKTRGALAGTEFSASAAPGSSIQVSRGEPAASRRRAAGPVSYAPQARPRSLR